MDGSARVRNPGALGWVIAAATNDWGTKIVAFLLALVVFVVTRDEVERTLTVPLRVVEDPDRVLLTETPTTVDVRLRGPWTKVNRIAAESLGSAVLDLREANPGPMELDPATIVMPKGVVLDGLAYDPIDLRFESIVERRIPIRATIEGSVAADYVLAEQELAPDHWTLRGPESRFADLAEIRTATIDLGDTKRDLERSVGLVLPPLAEGERPLEFVGAGEGGPSVRFTADIEPLVGQIEVDVATAGAVRAKLPELPELDLPSETVTIRGPLPLLREIDEIDDPLLAVVEVEPSGPDQALRAKLTFEWSPEVAQDGRDALTISPPLVILSFGAGE